MVKQIKVVNGAGKDREEITNEIEEISADFTEEQEFHKRVVANLKMDEGRANEFGKMFNLNIGIVDMAYQKVYEIHKESGAEGVALNALTEVSLFNVLAENKGEANIWAVVSRADFATDILMNAEEYEDEFDFNSICRDCMKKVLAETIEDWDKFCEEDIEEEPLKVRVPRKILLKVLRDPAQDLSHHCKLCIFKHIVSQDDPFENNEQVDYDSLAIEVGVTREEVLSFNSGEAPENKDDIECPLLSQVGDDDLF